MWKISDSVDMFNLHVIDLLFQPTLNVRSPPNLHSGGEGKWSRELSLSDPQVDAALR
jgi:hypothetical protein